MQGFYTQFGGGIGDLFVDVLESPVMRLLPGLVEDYNYRIRIYTQCHCAGAEDLFRRHPHVHEIVTEPWQDPRDVNPHRFLHPTSDGYAPLLPAYLQTYAGPVIRQGPFEFRYTVKERDWADELLSQRPVICLQPYAGLSDRDGFDPERLAMLCERLVTLDPGCRVLVLGKNHERNHKYAREELFFEHPQVVNLIDQTGMRMALLLVARCDAFCGAHSNLIRQAWRYRLRNACVMPSPSMTDALPHLDPRYTYGLSYPESQIYTYYFKNDDPRGRDFTTLDVEGLAKHLLGRV